MPDDAARSRLGRGLAALIGDVGEETQSTERSRGQRRVPIEFVSPNPRNPRQAFSETELDELVASIRERGIIQPILVRPVPGGKKDAYEIIAGERRWRAAQRAGQYEVPVIVLDVSDEESLELAIIENVQRTDLNAIEEAMGYAALANEFKHDQEAIAKIVGKSRSHVANTLRLLKLPEAVKQHVRAGKLTAGHARLLVNQPNAEELAEEIINRGLNVRQVEAWGRKEGKAQAREVKSKNTQRKDADTLALEKRVSDVLGLQVSVDHRGSWGILHVHYRDLEQLDEIVRRLERKA